MMERRYNGSTCGPAATYRQPYLGAGAVGKLDGSPMTQGIAENFIGVLRTEDRAGHKAILRHSLLIVVLLLFTGLLVDLPVGGFFGIGIGVVALTVVLGSALGLVTGRHFTVRRYHRSLNSAWNQWMRYSIACQRVDEVYRRVRGRPATRSVGGIAAVWTVLLFATLILVLLTVLDGVTALDKTPVFVGYGVYLGWLVGHTLALRLWVRDFLVSLDEMIRTGEVGLWGVV